MHKDYTILITIEYVLEYVQQTYGVLLPLVIYAVINKYNKYSTDYKILSQNITDQLHKAYKGTRTFLEYLNICTLQGG